VRLLQTCPIMENVAKSHDKPQAPSTNVGTPLSSSQPKLGTGTSKKKNCVNKSEVWLHFTKVEPIDLDNPKATCNYCNRMLGCHWRNGTSTMKVHLQNYPTFPLRKPDIPKGQTLLQPSFKKMSEGGSSNSNTNPLGFVKYDLIKIRKLINISSRRSCLFDMWRVMGLEN
jgi:hypothetical protein